MFDEKEAKAAQAHNEWLKQRPIQVSDSLMTVYRVKKCASVQEFQSYNPGAFTGLRRDKNPPKGVTLLYDGDHRYLSAGPSSVFFNDKGLLVYVYTVLGKTTDTATAKKIYRSFTDLYLADLDTSVVEKVPLTRDDKGNENARIVIKPLATGNKGSMLIFYFQFWDGAYIQLYFYPQ